MGNSVSVESVASLTSTSGVVEHIFPKNTAHNYQKSREEVNLIFFFSCEKKSKICVATFVER